MKKVLFSKDDAGVAKGSHCAYCDAPLDAPDHAAPSKPHYCCYGCRVLGETRQRPFDLTSAKGTPWFKIAVCAVLAGQAMLLDLAINLAPPEGGARWLLHAALLLSSLGVVAILGRTLLESAWTELRQRRVTIELLFLAGIAGALGASLHSSLTGTGAVYYEVVGVLLVVYSVGKTLGAQSRARALAEARHLHRTFDTCQKIEADGSLSILPVAQIFPGDQVLVRAGEPIPIDGRVVQGQAFVCETPLTGEPYPVVRRPGDSVLAGAYSEDGELRISATVPGTERQLDGLLALLNAARERPCRLQTQADRIVRWFLPLTLVVSVATFAFWTWHSGGSAGLFNALAVLLVACPCAMGLATPVALWSGLAALAARGLVLRSGDELERLAGLDRLVFDKTGTLSEEQFSLVDLADLGDEPQRQALAAQLCAVQNACSHPVARAFQPATFNLQPADLPQVRSLKAVPALGVEAWLESDDGTESYLRVGQRDLMSNLAAEPALLARLRHRVADYLVYVEVDGRLCAIAAVSERLRDSAREAIQALEQQGVVCSILTGDRSERAAQLLAFPPLPSGEGRGEGNGDGPRPDGSAPDRADAKGAGLSRDSISRRIQGSLTPEQKAAHLAALVQAGHRVGFVGDGVNDAAAMRDASVGIALAHGAGVTTTCAGAVLYGGDLSVLPWAVALSQRVQRSIRSNLLFAAAYNAVGMALAATGLLHPVASALLMVISSFTVSWRALRSTESVRACCTPGTEPNAAKPKGSSPSHQPSVVFSSLFPGEAGGEDRGEGVPEFMGSGRVQNEQGAPHEADPGTLTSDFGFRTSFEFRPSVFGFLGGRSHRALPRSQLLAALLVLAQAPTLIWLGHLSKASSLLTCTLMCSLSGIILLFRSNNPDWKRLAHMTFAMLGWGNWGMILGWWADAGFGPITGGCPNCIANGFSLWGFLHAPWMNLGMLLFSLPPMLMHSASSRDTSGNTVSARIALGLLSAVGMIWGMSFGDYVCMKWLGPLISERVLLSWAGMTAGMMLGMFLCCELGRAVALWKPQSK